LDGTTFTPPPDYLGPVTLTVAVTDNGNSGVGGALGDTQHIAIDVEPVNDAPTLTLPGPQSSAEDTPLAVTVRVQDVDAGAGPVRVTLTVAHGTLTLA